MLMATAGHVDHGKTTLIHALTGTHCDRLEEEKRRGMTIALGYALWTLKNGESISMIDVPGHEKLVRTMLSGAGGIDAVLLVVSGESGVMPQTREHLNACRLLGIHRAVVAMTFADRTDDTDGAIANIRTALQSSYPDAPIIPVSAPKRTGLDRLEDAVSALYAETAHASRTDHAPLLPIDRVFSMDGHGTVITGSLLKGRLNTETSLCVIPGERSVRCRAFQVHGADRKEVVHGHRVAINLAGEKQRPQVGDILTIRGAIGEGRVFDAEIQWLKHNRRTLSRKRALTLHLMGYRTQADVKADGEIEPGCQGTGRIRLERSIPLPPGGHFVLRGDPIRGFGSVVGGGRILDAHPMGRRSGSARVALASATPEAARLQLIREAGDAGLTDTVLVRRLPLPWVSSEQIHFDEGALQRCRDRLLAGIQSHHEAYPTQIGPRRDAIATAPIQRRAMTDMLQAGHLVKEEGWIRLPEHVTVIDYEQLKLKKKIMKACGKAGLAALHRDEILNRFPVNNKQIDDALRVLLLETRLVHSEGFYFAAREVLELRTLVAQTLEKRVSLPVSWLKEQVGVSRKHAIPLWTWLDQCGATRREGHARVRGPKFQEYAHGG